MGIHFLDPLSDSRWDDFVAHHPSASVFHLRGWLEALARTYGYEPLVLTNTPPGFPLKNGIVMCRVSSWMTGTRLVSLPFSDHCEPLLKEPAEFAAFINWLREEYEDEFHRYIELRPLHEDRVVESGFQATSSYWLHEMDLNPGLQQLFQGLHKNCFQRKIRRAEREGLSYEVGRSPRFVNEFYQLLLMTRRRHHLLPQPRLWFQNLVACMGDKVEIRLARKNGTAIAAILTLRHGPSVVYKYGCSDASLHKLGGMPFLFWSLIQDSKSSGAERIDFGRSDLDQEGLIRFKDRLGTKRKLLTYYRCTSDPAKHGAAPWELKRLREFFCDLPDTFLTTAGRVLYRHLG